METFFNNDRKKRNFRIRKIKWYKKKKIELRFSLRIPPTLDPKKAEKTLKDFFENYKRLNFSKIKIYKIFADGGFDNPKIPEKIIQLINNSAQKIFNKNILFLGNGGSIPFINNLYQIYNQALFFVTGCVGPRSNIHAPDEIFFVEYGIRLFQSLALFFEGYENLR